MLPFLKDPELVFGLCSPIGADNKKVRAAIKNELAKYQYKLEEYKITTLMRTFAFEGSILKETPLEARYKSYIDYANKLREIYGDSSLLGMICCAAIRGHRRKSTGRSDAPIARQAYLFDQFKRREEVDVLRQVYGGFFILISVYSDKAVRFDRLTDKICESHAISRPTAEHEAEAKSLVGRDEDEGLVPTGQRLSEVFPLADIFVNIDNLEEATKTIARFFQAFFGSPGVSPAPAEYGMYLAKAASLRSLDLSRQVGAAIIQGKDNVVALGCNEVPRAFGGQYWHGDSPDGRDYFRGNDENDRLKRSILADILRKLKNTNSIQTDQDTESLVSTVMEQLSTRGSSLRDSELMDLLEFGRIIHAEMSALSEAARFGKSTQNSTLFCTTFPCHICAKHIVAAGVSEVVFIEPYPKSYAEHLHPDSICVTCAVSDPSKVIFRPFIGISPLRYRELFQRTKRKDSHGKAIDWEESMATPAVELTTATYINNEAAVVVTLRTRLDELKDKLMVQSTVQMPELAKE